MKEVTKHYTTGRLTWYGKWALPHSGIVPRVGVGVQPQVSPWINMEAAIQNK